ncbi:neocarzinostatin apoprotein domain-containing protein [Nocardia pseudobrasiliensis]|uniref:Neocarzinostatin family protein n=1 Tax=Nocardia pseudobrasiliensis TaxID=45979 RepID=A0A370HQK2_9NOCA|nr:neocarzinostatin apoprotein domain-containing protein [Nocardia pseudobrasiliensis]RDI60575.1 neocarzinostatin family protein [Nocardia pseudobrasiliensis]
MNRRYRTASLIAALVFLAPAHAAAAPGDSAVLQTDARSGLAEGQRITVRGSGFRAGLAAVAVGLCREGFTNGLRDCDLDGGATFVNIAADGTFGVITLVAHPRFKDIDCRAQRCVIAAAPLPGTEPPTVIAVNSAAVPVDFAGSLLPAPTAAATAPTPVSATDTSGPSTLLWSLTAALLAALAALALADRRRL